MITNKTFDEIHIGDSASMQRVLTKQDIDLFGLMSGDMNPTHFSEDTHGAAGAPQAGRTQHVGRGADLESSWK